MPMLLSVTVPDVGRSKPAQRPNSVVLPLPDGPTMAHVWPVGMSKETLARTVSGLPPLVYVRVRL